MIAIFLKFDIHFFSAFLLLVVFTTMQIRHDNVSYSSKLFQRLIWINILMLVLEVLSWQFDQKPGVFNWYANYLSNMFFMWLVPLITCVWASYIDYHMFGSIERLRKRWYYSHVMIANSLLVLVNLFYPVAFKVSSQNVYSREPWMWLIVVMNAMVLLYFCVLAYNMRAKIQRELIFVMLLYVTIPSLAAIVQVSIYGAFIMWPTMAVTIVFTYIFLETVSTSKDYLTGLMSRLRVDKYIDLLLGSGDDFGILMIDLDGFKAINDTYGHHTGDEALVIFAKVLTKVFHSEKMIARYAGDEFVVVTQLLSKDDIVFYREEMIKTLNEDRIVEERVYEIQFSMGYHGCAKNADMDYETLLNAADQAMYVNKRKKKQQVV